MEEKVIKYVKAPSYASGIATGVSLAGKSSDGYLHLNFFREKAELIDEAATVQASERDGVHFQTYQTSGKTRSEPVREVLATISIDSRMFKSLRAIFAQMAQVVDDEETDSERSA